jgi:hypothetical protein
MKLKYVFDVHEDNYLVCFINEKKDKKDDEDMYFGDGSWDAIRLVAGGNIIKGQKNKKNRCPVDTS